MIITRVDWYDQLGKFELTLQNLKDNEIKCYVEKSFFGHTNMEYLGFWVTQNEIRPMNKKVKSIVNMTLSKNTKQERVFIGLLNYYMDIWSRRSHLLYPLNTLTPNKVKFKWTDVEQKAFDYIEGAVSHDTLLTYPDFNKRFGVYTDARYQHL